MCLSMELSPKAAPGAIFVTLSAPGDVNFFQSEGVGKGLPLILASTFTVDSSVCHPFGKSLLDFNKHLIPFTGELVFPSYQKQAGRFS